MSKDEVLRLALEALEKAPMGYSMESDIRSYKAITAIKQALAQPEPEPVATDWERIARVQNSKLMAMCDEAGGFEKLCEVMDKYERTAPPKREPVSGVVIREGRPTLVQDQHIRPTDQRLYTSPQRAEGEAPKREPLTDAFVVKHYASDERPIIKGNGFDGLEIGENREEAEAFVAWINERIAAHGIKGNT